MAAKRKHRASKKPTAAKRGPARARRHGFPPHARLFSAHVLPATGRAFAPAAAPAAIVRKSAADLTAAEQTTFKSAVTKAIADGIYSRLVRIHADMTHDMHTMGHMPAGTLRFLAWHRVYLVKFEQSLQTFEPTVVLPYWRWMDATTIPAWLTSFKPTGITDANGHAIAVTRNPGGDPATPTLPTEQTIRTTVMNQTDYRPFTLALEGAQPYGAHNLVHMWLNGTMSNVPVAPADPIFWMHHAEIDRLWAVWTEDHPGKSPGLTGAKDILDPWAEKASEALDTTISGYRYSYDRMTL